MKRPLILNRRRLVEVVNAFPPKPGGTPKPNPMPGQPPAPGQPSAAGGPPADGGKDLAASVKATVKMLDENEQGATDGQDAQQPSTGQPAGGKPGQAAPAGGPQAAGQGAGTEGQAAPPADAQVQKGEVTGGQEEQQDADAAAGEEAQDPGEAGDAADQQAVGEVPGGAGDAADVGPHPDDGRVTLTPEQIDAEVQQLLAQMHGGFSQLMAENVHDLSGTQGEDDAGALTEGSDGETSDDADAGAQDGDAEGEADPGVGGDAVPATAAPDEAPAGVPKPRAAGGPGVAGGAGPNGGRPVAVPGPGATVGAKPNGAGKVKSVQNAAHRCPTCGYRMDEDEWEDEECPNCGEIVNNEQERTPDGRFGSGGGGVLSKAKNALSSLGAKVDALASKIPVLHQIKDAGKRVTSSIHAGLENRYGSKVANAIMGGGFLGGYGVAGTAMKLFAFPGVPFVNDVVAIGVLAGAAEVGLQARKAWGKLTGNEMQLNTASEEMDGVDLDAEREAVMERLAGLVAKQIKMHGKAITAVATPEDVETAVDVASAFR